jgi:hypothetical protein
MTRYFCDESNKTTRVELLASDPVLLSYLGITRPGRTWWSISSKIDHYTVVVKGLESVHFDIRDYRERAGVRDRVLI